MPARNKTTNDKKRTLLRNTLWPGSANEIWKVATDDDVKGFTTISRLTSLILHLIKTLTGSKGGDPSRVYLELWCRDYGQGIISIRDEQECAYASGYSGARALRTWGEHVLKLIELGFIRTKRHGNREFGHILLLNPLQVCANLRAADRVSDEWWTAFVARAQEIGAEIPSASLREADVEPGELCTAAK